MERRINDKNGPRWWNNEKRTRRTVVDALHTIIERLDEIKELITEKKDESKAKNHFSRSDGEDNILEQVLSHMSNDDDMDFLDLNNKGKDRNEPRTRKN